MVQQEVEILRDLEDPDSITNVIQARYNAGWVVGAMTSLPWSRDVVITFLRERATAKQLVKIVPQYQHAETTGAFMS